MPSDDQRMSAASRLRRCVGLLFVVAILGTAPELAAQPYVEGEENRFRFAQLNLGVESVYRPAPFDTYAGPDAGSLERRPLADQLTPRLVIGGYHFWGHADFYVAFPLPSIGIGGSGEGLETDLSTGIETGARVYPWRLRYGAVRPFVGASWAVGSYSQTTDAGAGPTPERHHVPLQLGLTWANDFGNLELGLQWSPLLEFDYPVAPSATRHLDGPLIWAWLSYKYAFDTTLGGEESVESGDNAELKEAQAKRGVRSDLALAAGPSSVFTLRSGDFPAGEVDFLPDRPNGTLLPDVALGYYVAPADAAVRLNYRTMLQTQSGYGAARRYRRHSLSLDAFKMLFDYHGFVPFLGAGVSAEWLDFRQTDPSGEVRRARGRTWAGSVVFGWDIRPVETMAMLLRTNLRYTPALGLDLPSSGRAQFSQLEFNFIQVVFYPRRLFVNQSW